jgi:hypothetical protein
MKIWHATAAALAAAMAFSLGCGSAASSGCGGTPMNTNTNSQPVITCGAGTAQQGGVCVPTSTPVTH